MVRPRIDLQMAGRRRREKAGCGSDGSRGAKWIPSSAQAGHRSTHVRKREDPSSESYEELTGMEHSFVSAQGSAYMRFRRALDRGSVTEALSAASELQFVSLGGGARAHPATR